MTTPQTPQEPQRRALRRLAPAVVTVGVLTGVVVTATHGSQAQDAPLRFTASGSTTPVGNGTTNGNTDPSTGCNTNGNCVKSFGVAVTAVTGLWPGKQTTLPVTYSNPYSFGIQVTQATVAATLQSSSSGSPACSSGYVTTGVYPSAVPVAPNASTSVNLPFGLSAGAPDACKNARWTVTVAAQAVKQ